MLPGGAAGGAAASEADVSGAGKLFIVDCDMHEDDRTVPGADVRQAVEDGEVAL
jgi:hypothetical protein